MWVVLSDYDNSVHGPFDSKEAAEKWIVDMIVHTDEGFRVKLMNQP